MMYALIKGGDIAVYPYSIFDLKREFPSVSFTTDPSPEFLATLGVAVVRNSVPPWIDERSQNLVESVPEFNPNDQLWHQTWIVEEKTPGEKQEIEASQAASVRNERNAMISESDWTQLDDTPLTNAKKLEWATYRQALRDIPAQAGFPWEVVWPTKPE